MMLDQVLAPTSEEDVAEAVRTANGPIQIVGGGTRPVGEAEGQPLSVGGLSGITLYEPGALTLVARAGTPLSEVENTLAAEGQRLPFEPFTLNRALGTTGRSTIGGVVASNASGARRMQAGACRDSLIGVRFVDGSGQMLKNGGRVMKNVTGYDLVKLLCGSWGTLGVLTEVSFKLLPAAEMCRTVVVHGLDLGTAQRAMSAALATPFDVSGAAHDPQKQETYLRIEGLETSVTYRAGQLKERLSEFGEVEFSDDIDWAHISSGGSPADASDDLWRISVKPTDGPELAAKLGPNVLLDWSGGLIWAATSADVRGKMAGTPGHATLIRRGASTAPTFHPENVALAAISKGLRGKFDPRGILNPGLMTH